jgi:hypothetical protein
LLYRNTADQREVVQFEGIHNTGFGEGDNEFEFVDGLAMSSAPAALVSTKYPANTYHGQTRHYRPALVNMGLELNDHSTGDSSLDQRQSNPTNPFYNNIPNVPSNNAGEDIVPLPPMQQQFHPHHRLGLPANTSNAPNRTSSVLSTNRPKYTESEVSGKILVFLNFNTSVGF